MYTSIWMLFVGAPARMTQHLQERRWHYVTAIFIGASCMKIELEQKWISCRNQKDIAMGG